MSILQQDAFFWKLIHLTQSLATEVDKWKLFEAILTECQHITHCDGATLYLLNVDEQGPCLNYAMICNESLGLNQRYCHAGESALPPIRIHPTDSDLNQTNSIAAYCASSGVSVCVEDVYQSKEFNVSGIHAFDELFDYRTRSVLSVPIVQPDRSVLGVIQLINPQNPLTQTATHYRDGHKSIIEAMAAMIATILVSSKLENVQSELLIRLTDNSRQQQPWERALQEALTLTQADGGTIYRLCKTGEPKLEFLTMINRSLGIHDSCEPNTTLSGVPALYLEENGEPNLQNVATFTAISQQLVNIDNAYNNTTFDFSGMQSFDQQYDYHSCSFLSTPMLNENNEVMGVMQLINARTAHSRQIIPFAEQLEASINALARYAGTSLEAALLKSERTNAKNGLPNVAKAL